MHIINAAIAGNGFALGTNRPAGPAFLGPEYVLGAESLRQLAICPANWKTLGAEGDRRVGPVSFTTWAAVLLPERLPTLVAVRPETYTKRVLKCPACGSVSTANHCKKDDVDRVSVEQTCQWSRKSPECAAWEDVVTAQGKCLISTAEYGRILIGATALQMGTGIAEVLDTGTRAVALTGQLRNTEGQSLQVSELVAVMPGEAAVDSNCIYLLSSAKNTGPGPVEVSARIGAWAARAALALDLLNSATGQARNTARILVSSSSEQPEPAYCVLTTAAIQSGRSTYQTGAQAYLDGVANNQWPGFDRAGDGTVTWRPLDPTLS